MAKYGDLYPDGVSRWAVCGGCGFLHQNPRPTVDALARFYDEGRYHADPPPAHWEDAATYLAFARSYYGEKVDWARRQAGLPGFGRVFEVGAGHGGALAVFRERGLQVDGVEPDAALRAFAARVVGVTLRPGLLDRNAWLRPQADLVFSNHAFEHLHDLDEVMLGIRAILRPGGHLCTIVPTYAQNRSAMSRAWMNAAHYSLFTHRSLGMLLARFGFEEVAHTYRGWATEVDDLWHVARFTGRKVDLTSFREDARRVERYIRVWSVLNTAIHAPIEAVRARQRVRRVLARVVPAWRGLR